MCRGEEVNDADAIIEAGIAGGISYGISYMLFGSDVVPTALGNLSVPMISGINVALSTGLSELIQGYLMDPSQTKEWDDTLMGYLDPLLVGGSNILVTKLMTYGGNSMQEMITLFGIGALSNVAADYINSKMIEPVIDF